MDGVHDLGGMHGFGPVEREADEPVFHAPWEAVVVAIRRSRVMGRFFNIDQPMTARQYHDTARLRQAARQRDPGGDVLVRGIESEVRCVLVPGDERVVARLLDPHREVVDEQVRTDQVLDGGQYRRVADEVVEPGEEQMRLGAELSGEPAERLSLSGLEGLEPGPAVVRLGRRQRGDGTEKPVLAVARHLLVGQGPGHA
jgi:hypothetical protein